MTLTEYFNNWIEDNKHKPDAQMVVDPACIQVSASALQVFMNKNVPEGKTAFVDESGGVYYLKMFDTRNDEVPRYSLLPSIDTENIHDFISNVYCAYKNNTGVRIPKEDFTAVFGGKATIVSKVKPVLSKIEDAIGRKIHMHSWKGGRGATFVLYSKTIEEDRTTKLRVKEEYQIENNVVISKPFEDEVKQQRTHVYLITDGVHQKIGISVDVLSRLSALQTSNPNQLSLVASYLPTRRARDIESEMHVKYKAFRKSGEWFEMNITAEEFEMSCKEIEFGGVHNEDSEVSGIKCSNCGRHVNNYDVSSEGLYEMYLAHHHVCSDECLYEFVLG